MLKFSYQGVLQAIFVQEIKNQIIMTKFYNIFSIDFSAIRTFLKELPAASSNAIHR